MSKPQIASPEPAPAAIDVVRKRFPLRKTLQNASGVYLLGALILLFSLWVPETFLTATTLKSLAAEQSVTAILALGLLLPGAALKFDLSAATLLGASAIGVSWLTAIHGVSLGLAIVAVVAFGALVGAINGTLVVFVGIDAFIATLAMSSVLTALTLALSNNQLITGLPDQLGEFASPQVLGLSILFFYMLAIALAVWYILERHPIGRRLHAAGANPEAARLAGVRVGRLVFGSFVASGVVASIAGLLATARVGAGDPSLGPPYLLPAYAAVFLGTTQFKGGRVNAAGTLLAVFLLATGVRGLQLAGAQFWVNDLFNGVALAGAVGLAALARRRAASTKD